MYSLFIAGVTDMDMTFSITEKNKEQKYDRNNFLNFDKWGFVVTEIKGYENEMWNLSVPNNIISLQC